MTNWHDEKEPAVYAPGEREKEAPRQVTAVTCPHCDEAVAENEGVEGPHGNLWHYRCLEAWRESDG